ncbi:MAG TPA: tetratricopeptide repeat protein [Bryobacteraceae bacterium]|nr:tetratricopeptide repeat protein [Bryobacteraceae bacterium]
MKKGGRNKGSRPAAIAKQAAWWPHVWKIVLLCAVVLAAYSNSFDAGFVYDNETAILQDARVHEANLPNVDRIFTEGYWANQPTTDLYRPLTTLSYLFNYAILGNGTNPVGYHWMNLVLHLANVSLVYALGILIFGGPAQGLALAAIWGLHPLLTEGVTNIVGRADLLAAFGILAGLLCHMRATAGTGRRKVSWLIALTLSQTIGLFSKENAVILPALMLSYDLIWSEHFFGRAVWRRRIPSYAVLVLPFAGYFMLRSQLHMHLEAPFLQNPLVGAPFWPARMTAFNVIGRFLWLFIWPNRLSADYSYNSIPLFHWSLNSWENLQALIALALCVAGIALALRLRRENKPVCFFVFFFFIALAPTSNLFILIGSVMSERFLYLPAIGLTGGVIGLICALSRRYSQSAARKVLQAKAMWAAAGILCLALGARTYARNFDWLDEATLWTSVTNVNPDDALAHVNLGNALLEIPDRAPQAISEYQTALRIDPNYADAHNNLGAIFLQSGRITEAIAEYQAAVRLDPAYADARSNLGIALSRIPDRLDEAAVELETAVRLDPENVGRRAALGNVLLQMPGRIPEAIVQLQTAVRIDPDDAVSHYQLGVALSRMPGKLPEAIQEIQAAARIRPDPRLDELLSRLRKAQ